MILATLIGLLSAISIAAGVGLLIGRAYFNYALSEERCRATEAGVAHYVADGNTGEVRFEYIERGKA